jgi:hypothetical protein
LVEHDLMAARNDPLVALLPPPGHRLATFTQWFERTINEQLVNTPWWEKFLERAYESGVAAGGELTRSPPRSYTPVPAVYREFAKREFAGIAAATMQQVSRQAAAAAIGRRKPLPMYQRVLAVLRKIGHTRMKAAANTMAVQLHNAGRLAAFREAGITQVGIDPERLEPARPSRFIKHDHRLHDQTEEEEVDWVTAGDELVCPICESLAEQSPYKIDLAEALLPAHINCRCSLLPAGLLSLEERLGESE